MADYQIVQSNTFQGGLVTLQPAHLLQDGATPSCANVDFSTSLGRLTKRNGYSLLQNANLGSGHPVTGLFEYIKAVGTTIYYAVVDKILYEITPASTWTSRFNNTSFSVTSMQELGGGAQVRVTCSTNHGFSLAQTVYFFGGTNNTANQTPLLLAGTSQVVSNVVSVTVFDINYVTPGITNYVANCGSVTASSAPTNGNNIGATNFVTFNNICIAVSPQISTLKSTGSAFSLLLGSPPANASYIESHKGRVWIANTSAGASRLHYCYLNNPEDWTTITGASTDAGYIDVGLDDGETITGIKTIGSVLLVFKQTSTWAVFGSTPQDFKVRKISPNIGCVAPRSIVACDTFAIFLSNLGVYSANSEGCTMLSYNIKPTLDAWTSTQRAGAVAGRLNTQYWLAVDTDADSVNDTVYYLDYVYGVWGLYTNKKDNIYYTRRDGTLISGGGDTDVVRKQDDTTNDNGSAITMTWDTPDFDFGDWTLIKHPTDIIVSAYPISGKTLTVSHLIDGVLQGTTLSMSLTASGSQNKIYLVGRGTPSTSYSRFIRFRFTNAETSAPVQIFAYSIRAFLDARQNG